MKLNKYQTFYKKAILYSFKLKLKICFNVT
jgi:hypothetical protein